MAERRVKKVAAKKSSAQKTATRKPPVKKTVFLDQGIRYWGKARIFALAVAASLNLKDTKDNITFRFTSHINGRFKDIELDTHEDILAMMEVLESSLSPVDALKHFFFHNDMSDEECLFIFHEKQMSDPKKDFRKALRKKGYTQFVFEEYMYVLGLERRAKQIVLEKLKELLQDLE